MSHGTTLDPVLRPEGEAERAGSGLALVVAWFGAEPTRAGEVLLVPDGGPSIFGRGAPRGDDPLPRVTLVRQRPARAGTGGRALGPAREPVPPVATPFLSRVQLRLAVEPEGVRVENLGRCALLVGDRKVTTALLAPGDTLELHDQLVLLCVRRPLELPLLRSVTGELGPFGEADAQGLVGESPAFWELRDRVAFFAARDVHVLLLGESGTGKELAARAIHALSSRKERALVSRNAATLPPGLVDAELFGNVKNYPHAGMPERLGLVGEASGGVLFLDEIGELPLDLQTHLLRVLDERGEYQRLGESSRRTSDLRLIAATNRAAGELRSDILARMSLRLTIPGLNERREDIPLLVRHLLRRVAERDPGIRRRFFAPAPEGTDIEPRIAPALVRALLRHRYTTHVREVDAILWQALASSESDRLELTSSVEQLLNVDAAPAVAVEVTHEALEAALEKHGGVKEKVWRELGLQNRYALNRLLKKYGLQKGDGD
jgi:two-component system, NtrC family, response regulator HydG